MSRSTMTVEERAAYREEKRKEAEDRLDMLLSEEGWATWLRLRRHLHTFSWTNQVLIAEQAHKQAALAAMNDPAAPSVPCSPQPTIVKSAGRWKKDGYHPAKGTRGLFVWTPHERGRKHDGAWACCGILYPKKVRECEKCGRGRLYFQLKAVFDASQVRSFETGEPPVVELPQGHPIEGDDPGDRLIIPLIDWATGAQPETDDRLVDSVYIAENDDHGEGGWFAPAKREIRLNRRVDGELQSGNAMLRVLVHELAHAKGINQRDADLDYAEAEVAVECVSFIVAGTAGLDTGGEAIPYIAGWGGEDARDKVRALAQLIDETAKELEQPILALLEPAAEHEPEGVAA